MWGELLVGAFVVAMSGVFTGASGQTMDEYEYVAKVRSLEETCRGAAYSSQRRFADRHGRETIESRIVVHSGVVVRFREDTDAPGFTPDNIYVQEGPEIDRWYTWGYMNKEAPYCISGFGPRKYHGTWAEITKDYQTDKMTYYVLLNTSDLVDQCRIGQKVSFEGTIAGLGPERFWRTFIVNASVTTETTMLRCANGHEFAPSAGFKYCPHCGLPLK